MSAGIGNRSSLAYLAVSAAAISFAVYYLTLAQSVGWHDSAELAMVAWQLGASHAPGSPVHSMLGHFMVQFFEEPFRGTSLLSLLSASATAGILALLIYMLKRDALTALCAALIYAFSYQVWASAVVTEIYSLSMLFLSLTLLYAVLWNTRGGRRYFLAWLLAYSLTLGTYFANILLFPAFAYLIYSTSGKRTADLLVFSVTVGLTIVLIGIANYFLAQNALPFGEIAPDSLVNMLLYMSGSQHAPLQMRDSAFLVTRLAQHLDIFSRSVLFLGLPLGLLGAISLARVNKGLGVFLALIFAIYMSYYTIFGPGDYFMMVLPAYFVFSVWIAMGVLWLLRYDRVRSLHSVWRMLPVFIVVGLLAVQLDGRRAMAHSLDAEKFAADAFALLPPDALAVTGWKEFSTLRYHQEVDGVRPDLRVVVPARSIRRYRFGEVADYVDLVGSAICISPIYTTKELADLGDQYTFRMAGPDSVWMIVTHSADTQSEFCR